MNWNSAELRSKPNQRTRDTRKVMSERTGQLLMMRSASPPEEIPADDQHHANQHDEGIVIDIAGLQPPGPLRQIAGERGYPVGPEAIDDGAIAALPEQAADLLRRIDEEEV